MTFVSHRKPDHPAWWRVFARWLFGLFGWKAVGEVPDLPKFVLIGAPHTSNWDGLLMVGITIILGFKMQWLGKHTLFKFPFGGFMRFIGGVPVYRHENRNMTGQAVDAFNAHERFILLVAPEGTRSYTTHWKLGFYHIAMGANVPIVLGFVDYPRKVCGLGPVLYPSGDLDKDFEFIRAFYADKVGANPANHGPITPRRKSNKDTSGAAAESE